MHKHHRFVSITSHYQISFELLLQLLKDQLRSKRQKLARVTELVLVLKWILDHSISMSFGDSFKLVYTKPVDSVEGAL